jgi:ribonuclease HI
MDYLGNIFKDTKRRLCKKLSGIFSNVSKTLKTSKNRQAYDFYQADGYIHVFTDGSNSLKKARLGMGWVIKINVDDELLYWEGQSRVNGIAVEDQNIAAEILAVTNCLRTLPVGARVKLHTDLGDIVDFVNKGDMHDNTRNRSLRSVWKLLEDELSQHKEVRATYSNDKDYNKNQAVKRVMRIAHNLAALASGANTQKELLSDQDIARYGHIFTKVKPTDDRKKYGSTPGALDIR